MLSPPPRSHRNLVRRAKRAARLALAVACVAGTGCGAPDREPRAIDPVIAQAGAEGPAVTRLADSTRVAVDTVARGLRVPWGVAALPDGRLLVTERAGRIRVIDAAGLRAEPWATLDVYADDPRVLPEAGLMGIAPSPDFAATGHVYVLGTVVRHPRDTATTIGARLGRRVAALWRDEAERSGLENVVWRLTDRGGRGTGATVVYGGFATGFYHAGGALRMGPDSALYATLGDAMLPEHAGSPTRPLARVLRIEITASPERDAWRSATLASGLRNAQGIAWHPRTGEGFVVDHGPTGMAQEGGRSGNDELDQLRPGGWYGWGARPPTDPAPVPPLAVWPSAIAPAGLAWAPPAWGTDVLLVTGLRSGALHRLAMARDSSGAWVVRGEERLLEGRYGRLRALAVGRDGAVYVGTSNHDGRGRPRPGDDLLLRVRPAR